MDKSLQYRIQAIAWIRAGDTDMVYNVAVQYVIADIRRLKTLGYTIAGAIEALEDRQVSRRRVRLDRDKYAALERALVDRYARPEGAYPSPEDLAVLRVTVQEWLAGMYSQDTVLLDKYVQGCSVPYDRVRYVAGKLGLTPGQYREAVLWAREAM